MNKSRRNSISEVIIQLDCCKKFLLQILDAEENAKDSMPENLQSSIKYEELEENIEVLENCIDSLDDIIENLKEV